ncbi:MAG TPA: hypothetical protein VMK83_03150 [Gaiellaceae bacterium]|nr:hypothetical protein [Gaiellaceae bacterium]
MTTGIDRGIEPLLLPPRLRALEDGDRTLVLLVAYKLWSAQRVLHGAS